MKSLRKISSRQEFNTIYNVNPTWETTHIGVEYNSSRTYCAYVGQVGNMYRWEGDYYTMERNPVSVQVYDANGDAIQYCNANSNLFRIVRGPGYVEPWTSLSGGIVDYNAPREYNGGILLDMRNPERNPNMEKIGERGDTDQYKYLDYKIKDDILPYIFGQDHEITHIVTDWYPITVYGQTWLGYIKVARIDLENLGSGTHTIYEDWKPYTLYIEVDGSMDVYSDN